MGIPIKFKVYPNSLGATLLRIFGILLTVIGAFMLLAVLAKSDWKMLPVALPVLIGGVLMIIIARLIAGRSGRSKQR